MPHYLHFLMFLQEIHGEMARAARGPDGCTATTTRLSPPGSSGTVGRPAGMPASVREFLHAAATPLN
jgi:hypothetical protein